MAIPILGDIIDAVKDVVSEVVVDKDKRAELDVRLQELRDKADERRHDESMGQIEVNKVEAQHRSVFIAGWRPAVGWVAAAGLAAQCIVFPLLHQFGLPAPDFDTELLILTLGSILGVGGMRSYDKRNGTSNDVLRVASPPQIAYNLPEVRTEPRQGNPINLLPESVPWER